MAKNSISQSEYRELLNGNKFQNTRKSSPLRKDNKKSNVCKQTVSEIQQIQGNSPDFLFNGSFGIEIKMFGKQRGDIDNYAKGILDSLQGIAYTNDRDCKRCEIEFCES